MAGLKPTFKNFMNRMQIKQEVDPYILFLMREIYDLLEDVYSVESITELQQAIDAIGTGAGTIFIAAGTYEVDTTIDIDNCGSLVIYGHGDNTILQAAAGTTVFNITCTQRCLIRTLKIDINNYNLLAPNTQAVVVNETNNNIVGFEDVTIDGDGSNGIGIEFQSDNCYVTQCNITDCKKGMYINNSDKHILTNNTITGHADYGIHADSSNYLTLTTNTCGTNDDYGIYLDTITYSTISGNICNSNTKTGIYCGSCTNNTINNNSSNSNSENGIYITGSSYNTISGNTLNSNDSSSASNTAGLYITTNSDYNTISGNNINNNNNSGAGIGYGIYIATVTCNENVIASNNCNGNDVDYEDEGTDTTIIYYVQNNDEIQDAIDSIGAGTGTIVLTSGNISITTMIDIDGGGSYTIKGQGDNTVLVSSGDITIFNITSDISCLFSDFKVNMNSYTVAGYAINIDATADNVRFERINFEGDSDADGRAIFNYSSNLIINECSFTSMNYGIDTYDSDNLIISNNKFTDMRYGVVITDDVTGSKNCTITSNIFNNGTNYQIYLYKLTGCTITGNVIDNTVGGGGGIFCASTSTRCNFDGNTIANAGQALQLSGVTYCNASNNIIKDCDQLVGISIISGSNNTITGNTIDSIAGNSNISDVDGILIRESDNNVISNNVITNITNAGTQNGYGIHIEDALCNDNIVKGNHVSGCDIQWKDVGINTEMEYVCRSATDIQQAIDSISDKSGTIVLGTGIITITSTIDIDGGGYYILEGKGDSTILTINGDIKCINIINAQAGTILKNFKIDANSLTTFDREIIDVSEGSDNKIFFENITIVGDNTNGTGIEINSDNVIINKCEISNVGVAILGLNSVFHIISDNKLHDNNGDGINLNGHDTTISGNICNNSTGVNSDGIYIYNCYNITVGNNLCNGNAYCGIEIDSDAYDNVINGNTCSDNISNSANNTGGIKIDRNSDKNIIIGNVCNNNSNIGGGNGYGIIVDQADCNNNIIAINTFTGNDIDFSDNGTETCIFYDNLIQTSGTLSIIPSGQTTDYLDCYVNGGEAYIKRISGILTYFTSDDTVTQQAGIACNYGSETLTLIVDDDDDFAQLYCTNDLRLVPSGQTADYINISVSGGNPIIKAIGTGAMILTTDGGSVLLQPSNDTDDYIEFYTSGNETYMKRISGNKVILSADDADFTMLAFESSSDYIGLNKTGSKLLLISQYPIDIRPSGDNDDYIEFYTSGDETYMKRISGSYIRLESDGAASCGLYVWDDSSHYGLLWFHKTDHYLSLLSSDNIRIISNGDTDDYVTFYTSGNITYIESVGTHLRIGGGSGGYCTIRGNATNIWHFQSDGIFRPTAANTYDIGTSSYEPRQIYHCGLSATTCADFSQFTLEETMEIINWEALSNVYEVMKDGTKLPHINMKTVHPLLSGRYNGHNETVITIEKDEKGNDVEKETEEPRTSILKDYFVDLDGEKTGIQYNIGDGMYIDFENLVYAQNHAIKELYKKIKELESKINVLEKGN